MASKRASGLVECIAPQGRRIWLRGRSSVRIEELSRQIGIDETRLPRLNNVDEDHRFYQGDWLAVPSRLEEV